MLLPLGGYGTLLSVSFVPVWATLDTTGRPLRGSAKPSKTNPLKTVAEVAVRGSTGPNVTAHYWTELSFVYQMGGDPGLLWCLGQIGVDRFKK